MLTPLVFASVVGAGWHRLWHERAGQDQILFQPRKPTYRFEAARGFSDEFGPNQEYWLHECRHDPPPSPPPPSLPPLGPAADDTPSFPRAAVAVPTPPNDGDRATSAQHAAPKTADDDASADERRTTSAEKQVAATTTTTTTSDSSTTTTATSPPPISAASELVSKLLVPLSSPPPSFRASSLGAFTPAAAAPSDGSAAPSSPSRSPSSFLSWIFRLPARASSPPPPPATPATPLQPSPSSSPLAVRVRLLIVFMHGTSGNIGTARTQMLRLVDIVRQQAPTTPFDLVIVAPEYPGYGPETFYEVQPTEETAKRAVWNTVRRLAARYPAHRLVLVGYSIGAAFASWLATRCAPPRATPAKASSLWTSSSSSSSSSLLSSRTVARVVSASLALASASPPSSPAPPSRAPQSTARTCVDTNASDTTTTTTTTTAAATEPAADGDEEKKRMERAADARTAPFVDRRETRLDDGKSVVTAGGRDADAPVRETQEGVRAATIWTEYASDRAHTFLAPMWVAVRRGAVADADQGSPRAATNGGEVRPPQPPPRNSVCVRALTGAPEAALRPVTRLTRAVRCSRPLSSAALTPPLASSSRTATKSAPTPSPPLATRCPTVHGLMLVSGFSSARALFKDFGAERFTAASAFDNASNVAQLAPSVPLFLVHGVRDTLIDATHSRVMYDASRSANKRLVLQRNRDHLDVRFLDHLARFVLSLPS